MFPIRDHNPSGRTPWVTRVLLIINIVVFALAWIPWDDEMRWGLIWVFGMVPAEISEGRGYLTFVTNMFFHGGWLHLLGNMLFLWIFGDNMEDAFGHFKFLLFYLASGFAATFAEYLADPQLEVPLVGASGAIAGVLGGYLLLFPKARVDVLFIFIVLFRIITIRAWIVLLVWFGLQLLGVSTPDELDADGSGVAYWAHAGGFMAGFALSLPFFIRNGGRAYWQRNQGSPPHDEARYELSPSRIPRVVRRR